MHHECAKIDRNVKLLHQVHMNLEKHIELCITNGGDHVENVIIMLIPSFISLA